MRVSVHTELLRQAVVIAASSMESRSGTPILRHLLLEADGGYVRVTGTDLLSTAQGGTDATVHAPGRVVVPGAMLLNALRYWPEPMVQIETQHGHLILRQESGDVLRMVTREADEFPMPSWWEGSPDISISALHLQHLISRTSVAAATEVDRPVLQGVYLHTLQKRLCAAATDGYRLGQVCTEVAAPDEWSVIVDARRMSALVRLLAAADTVGLTLLEHPTTMLQLQSEQLRAIVLPYEGVYPRYQYVIPRDEPQAVVEVDAGDLRTAIQRFIAISSKVLHLEWSDGRMSMHGDSDVGDGTIHLPVISGHGHGRLTVSTSYLRDLARVFTDQVRLMFYGSSRPLLARSHDTLHLVMPIVRS